jgi:arginase
MDPRRTELIVVPYVLGREGAGMGAGPLALLDGAMAALSPERVTRLSLSGPFGNEIGACFDLNRQVAVAVAEARGRGTLPVVLTGNCHTQQAVVSGLDPSDLGLVWLDAHADFHTMDTTPTGFVDGTGLAMVTGETLRALCGTVAGFTPLPASDVLLVGVRDTEPAERARLDASPITESATADIAALLPAPSRVSLHLDLDVLDPAFGRANAYAVGPGLSPEDLLDIERTLDAQRRLAAITISAYDPQFDPERTVAAAAHAVLAAVAGR